MALGGWRSPQMLARYVDPREHVALVRSAIKKMP
jgi:hypothetical protein